MKMNELKYKEICEIHKSEKSVIQTIYDIVKAQGGVPIAIGMKVETVEGEGSEFIITIPI
jgi:uncharacterized protein (DUF1330 family)